MKQIEKAFTDLSCYEILDFNLETTTDLLAYLGYYGDQLPYKDRIAADAFKSMGGTLGGRNITKRSFIVFLNAINNVYL